MRKLALLLCILVILVAATTATSADKKDPDWFTITGYTTFYEWEILPNGLTSFHLIARGGGDDATYAPICGYISTHFPYGEETDTPLTCQQLCETYAAGACGVGGDLTGEFIFEEWGQVDFNPETLTGTGAGTNHGIITITAPDHRSSTVIVPFVGETDSVSVWGEFEIEKKTGTGAHKNLEGVGTYVGNGGLVFTVTFTGDLKGLKKVKG